MKRTGFTRTQFLIVLTIIGTLIAVLLPSVNNTREAAEAVAVAGFEADIELSDCKRYPRKTETTVGLET